MKAYREGLGKIELSRKGINHSIFHGNSAAKQAAFAAVKDVIEHGKQVYEDQDHKGMRSDTYTFAAPVTFGTEKIGMPVVVRKAGVIKTRSGIMCMKLRIPKEICWHSAMRESS